MTCHCLCVRSVVGLFHLVNDYRAWISGGDDVSVCAYQALYGVDPDSRQLRIGGQYYTSSRSRRSRDVTQIAVASAVLGIIEAMLFSAIYPALPPILVVPFVTCFIFAITLAFGRKQWIIGFVSFILTTAIRGALMPGQLMIPLYGLVFQGARAENAWSCRLAGFSASALHALYGMFLAPMIFSVAPATAILSLVRGHSLDFGSAMAICAVTFGLGGILSADVGRRLGIRILTNAGAWMR
jgi:hypothetical protein